ncbi:UDP-2,3-diacylglucosamine diphosphatase [Helicobacter cetorum]|uniref:UDP-2,3-diacylglucosamine diphosphatase n=1 Tax=Helicobacter cetorum TaxID=138563 RepID=UPI000CF08016|nr:metallophosphoesterase [Helicobacter cetorum]
MNQNYELKEGAIFISDAHFLPKSSHLIDLLKELLQTKPPQVFFMGDIFHALVGYLSLHSDEQEVINLINALSKTSQVFYFEGNHDFSMRFILNSKIIIFKRKQQPALFQYNNKRLLLAHGDLFITKAYEFYITQLTSTWARYVLLSIDKLSFHALYPLLRKLIYKKPIRSLSLIPSHSISFAKQRLKHYQNFIIKKGLQNIDGIIEGHFHINQETPLHILCNKHMLFYHALPSFYNQQSIFKVSLATLELS